MAPQDSSGFAFHLPGFNLGLTEAVKLLDWREIDRERESER